ncbi:MAG: 1-acyl-sn-glycerol-3-phosphate acyltransferase [Pseudomonadales bacterium]|jgi:1-acyl-sn-glycerol-3-phosphate acyltransferase
MLIFLPPFMRGIIAGFLLVLNTVVLVPFLLLVSIARCPIPNAAWHRFCTNVAIKIAELWIANNSTWMRLTQKMNWDVEGIESLDKNQWYLVTSNHQSWSDIFILQHLLNRKIPMLKFFLKQELIWVPIIGVAWWALDFPFMKRYSKEFLEKHPEKRGEDFANTKKACKKFEQTPVAVFNFLEGTRFTPEKHDRQQSPYNNLLKPKAGGIGFVVGAMGNSISCVLDITISYPNQQAPSLGDFMTGQVDKVIVRAKQLEMPASYLGKNYSEDEVFRAEFQQWVSKLWEEKDTELDSLLELSKRKGWSDQ